MTPRLPATSGGTWWAVNTRIHTYWTPGRAWQTHTFGHITRERSSLWPCAANRGTSPCAPQCVDMTSRRDQPHQAWGRRTRPLGRSADMHREGAYRRPTGGAREQRGRRPLRAVPTAVPIPPPDATPPPPPRKKPRFRRSNRAVELASNRVHARRQARRRTSSGRALAGSEVTYSRGERGDCEQQLTRARLMRQLVSR